MPEATPKAARSEVRWGPTVAGVPVAPDVPDAPLAPNAAVEQTQAAAPVGIDNEAERLEVLRALERGELDVDTAWTRLSALEDAAFATSA
jgi:hypothetical protein